nr:MAG TPA: Concanavalin A-like lectin/glucanase superfamily protein [Caudoviricetes sp.]
MALQVWLPLNGKIENCGIAGDEISITGTPSYVNGIIGKALHEGGVTMTADMTGRVLNNKAFSYCCWFYVNADTGSDNKAMIFGNEAMGAGNNRKFSIFQYPTCNDLHLSWMNDTANATYVGMVLQGVLPSKKWTHIAVVYDNPVFKIYINGKLEYTNSGVSNSSSFAYATALIHDSQYHYLADVRIYDNTLSPKEVHEISLGLCCHYPLNDPYATGSINKYSGDNFEGKPSGSSYTVTKLANERGYNYKLSYTGTGNNTWPNFYFPTFNFTAGKTYDYSCKVRCHSKNFDISFRAAHISNDWVTSMKTITVADNQWHEYHIQIKLDAKYTRSGTEYDTKPLVEFYSESLVTKDKVYTCDFDLKDVCVSECNTAASGSNGSWADSTVYDTSGFGNHAVAKNTSYMVYTNNTPRYTGAYRFVDGGKPYINTTNFSFETMQQGTVSLWVDRFSTTATWRNFIFFANFYDWMGNKSDFIIFGTTGNSGLCMDCCSNVVTVDNGLNKWNMYSLTWDLTTHTAKYYVNGVLVKTVVNEKINTTYASAHNQHFIGNAMYDESDYALSDFRIYATTLSDADIAELYNTPVSITSTGTMLTKGELIET